MLLIISDLHLTDGSTGSTVGSGAFEDFRENLIDLATDASSRRDGSYRPLDSIEIVLLGDIFDIIRSIRWTDPEDGSVSEVRPWHDSKSPAFVAKVSEVCDAILAANSESFAILKGLAIDNPITIPTTKEGQDRTAVKTNIYYVVGNHDWFLHLPGEAYEAIREKIRTQAGLANPPGPFPHDPFEADWLMNIYKDHGVFARHGDIYDDFNFDKKADTRDIATLGDAFVLEIINRFPRVAVSRLQGSGIALDPGKLEALTDGLKEVANVRPSLLVPVWVSALLENLQIDDKHAAIVKEVWDELGRNFLNLKFVKDQDTINPLDPIDKVQLTLRAYDLVSFETAADFLEKANPIAKFISNALTGFDKYAADEKVLKEPWVRHIVYGHTHHFEVVPLDKPYGNDQLYYNSGTWLPVHEMTKKHRNRFVYFHVMSYLAFFKGGERKGRPFETWSGTLGVRPS